MSTCQVCFDNLANIPGSLYCKACGRNEDSNEYCHEVVGREHQYYPCDKCCKLNHLGTKCPCLESAKSIADTISPVCPRCGNYSYAGIVCRSCVELGDGPQAAPEQVAAELPSPDEVRGAIAGMSSLSPEQHATREQAVKDFAGCIPHAKQDEPDPGCECDACRELRRRMINRLGVIKEKRMSESTALKYDDGKLPLNLLPFESLIEVTKVLEHGRKKYGAHNWRSGLAYMRLVAAILRHVFAFATGENRDPETGLLHTAHAICGLLFLTSYQLDHRTHTPSLDDRIRPSPSPAGSTHREL